MKITIPKNLSPSAIGTIQQCPLKYKFSKIDRIPEPSNETQLLGSFAHEILAHLFAYPQGERTIEKAREIAKNLWQTKWEGQTVGVIKATGSMFRWQVWWCVENLFKLENPDEVHVSGVEHWVRGAISKVPMVGIIDRWDNSSGSLVVTDYKTGKIPTRAEYEEEKGLQLAIYGHMLEKETGNPVGRTELLYLKDGKRVEYPFDENIRETMIKTVTATWEKVFNMCDAGSFPPQPSVLCGWCSYKQTICPVYNKEVSDEKAFE